MNNAIANHLNWRFRNQAYSVAIALGIVGLLSFSTGIVFKSLPVKLTLFGLSTGSFMFGLGRFRYDYKMAELTVKAEESAFAQGYREEQVKRFAPIDARPAPDAIATNKGDEFFDCVFDLADPVAQKILLVLAASGIEADFLGAEDAGDRNLYFLDLPVGAPKKIDGNLLQEIKRKSGLTSIPELIEVDGIYALSAIKAEAIATPEIDPEAIALPDPVDQPPVSKTVVKKDLLPDGAKLISPKEIGDCNRYPIVFVCCEQGSGKTATMGAILTALDGYKAIASPKPLSRMSMAIADVVFGYNKRSQQWGNFGRYDEENFGDDRDLTWWLEHSGKDRIAGSMLAFLWAAMQEANNRQNAFKKGEYWRCFYDEASKTYINGFDYLMEEPKYAAELKRRSQTLIESGMKLAMQDFRSQRVQLFVGCHSKTIDSVGLKGFAAARDEAWFLFPGRAGILEAKSAGKYQLHNWMSDRVAQGKGVALLVKKDLIYEVVNLPDLETLSKISEDQ